MQHSEQDNRRTFLRVSALGTLSSLLNIQNTQAATQSNSHSIILFYCAGAISQFDSFTPHPADAPTEYTGGKRVVHSEHDYPVSEYFPQTASVLHKAALIRTIQTPTPCHFAAPHIQWTKDGNGRPFVPQPAPENQVNLKAPSHMSFFHRFGGKLADNFFPYVNIRFKGSPSQYNAFVPDESFTIAATNNPREYAVSLLNDPRLKTRESLLKAIEKPIPGTDSMVRCRQQAFDILTNSDALADSFDLKGSERLKFGRDGEPTTVGDATLLATKLADAGSGITMVYYEGEQSKNPNKNNFFDMHSNLPSRMQVTAPFADGAISGLINHCSETGQTALIMSEFGRTPKFNNEKGRDHFPVHPAILAGGNVIPAAVHGTLHQTNPDYGLIASGKIHGSELENIILHAAGASTENLHPRYKSFLQKPAVTRPSSRPR